LQKGLALSGIPGAGGFAGGLKMAQAETCTGSGGYRSNSSEE